MDAALHPPITEQDDDIYCCLFSCCLITLQLTLSPLLVCHLSREVILIAFVKVLHNFQWNQPLSCLPGLLGSILPLLTTSPCDSSSSLPLPPPSNSCKCLFFPPTFYRLTPTLLFFLILSVVSSSYMAYITICTLKTKAFTFGSDSSLGPSTDFKHFLLVFVKGPSITIL